MAIHATSTEGAIAAILDWPRGEKAYPRSNWRSVSNSSTRAELWIRASDIAIEIAINVTGRKEAPAAAIAPAFHEEKK
jgi:hypothetical protein